MKLLDDLKRMRDDLYRRLEENAEDIRRVNERRRELEIERIRIYDGIVGIERELKRLEDKNGENATTN